MNYFILEYDMKKYEQNGIMAYHSELYGIDVHSVERGILIGNWNEKISFYSDEVEGSIFTDYVCNDLVWFIISEKFKIALEEIKVEGLQYLPVSIVNKRNGVRLGNYYVINICNLIDAIDIEESECFEIGNGLYSFITYAIRKEKANGLDIFRTKQDNIPIFISERIRNVIKSNNITGCDFIKIKTI